MNDNIKPPLVPTEPDFSPPQNNNPTDNERHALLYHALKEAGRIEDFNNIIDLLSPPTDIMTICKSGDFNKIKVGIIGGGLAGMASAYELKKLGFDITIFDALEDRIGGRVYTYYFNHDKSSYGELGAMRIPISHEATWHYINLFKLKTRPFLQYNENTFLYNRNTRARNDSQGKNVMEKIYPMYDLRHWEEKIPWTKLVDYAFGTPLKRMHPSLRKEILEIKPIYRPRLLYWTEKNNRQVMEKMGLSQPAISLISSLSPFVGQFNYNSYYGILQDDYPLDFTYLYEIVGGFVNLPMAFYNALMSHTQIEQRVIDIGSVTWKRGCLVTDIFRYKGEVGLQYEVKCLQKKVREVFDYIICAIPFSSLRNVMIDPMFSVRKMDAIREMNYAPAQKTLFQCNRRFWEAGDTSQRIVGGGSFTDMPIASLWYPSDHANLNEDKSKDPGVLLASYNFNLDAIRLGNLDEKRRVNEIKQQVELVHDLKKGTLNSIVEDFRTIQWNREPNFYGAFCNYMPGQKRLYSFAITQPEYEDKIFFAGEHTSSTPAWMQGALHSGMRAANQLALVCKRQ